MLSGFELYPRWVPLTQVAGEIFSKIPPKEILPACFSRLFVCLCIYYLMSLICETETSDAKYLVQVNNTA